MGAALRLATWAEERAPALARAIAVPRVRGAVFTRTPRATVWRASGIPDRALVVCFVERPSTSRWLAGSLAVRLRSVVVVPDATASSSGGDSSGADAPVFDRPGQDDPMRDALAFPDAAGLAGVPTAIVGEGSGTRRAVEAARTPGIARLALISPTGVEGVDPVGLPTTLLQADADGIHRSAVVRFDASLRRAGIAVRETEYAGIGAEWASYPRLVRGSGRALDDLVAFLDRGIGEASTFDVIPGWDLH